MIKKIIVILTTILIVVPIIIIINLPDLIVGYYRIEDHFATNKIKPYSKQIEELENTEKSLRSLQAFVSEQKEKLIDSEKILQDLKGEHDKLKPIVESDKRIIEAVFETIEKRQRTYIWVDRGLGFLIGIGASLMATLIWHWIKSKWAGGRSKLNPLD